MEDIKKEKLPAETLELLEILEKELDQKLNQEQETKKEIEAIEDDFYYKLLNQMTI
ncbi:MAG: hypothetical protein N2Z85_02615 [Patescibacteria group bacterium]|nr:hypothetical protein [Patescibacteria group bacterium]